jgi:PKD repeat protein
MTTGYTWDFGDLTNGTGITVFKTYQSAGVFSVKLTKSNEWGSSTSSPQDVEVISTLEIGDILSQFQESTIYGTLKPGEYTIGNHPITSNIHHYAITDASGINVNRFYYEIDDSIGAHGGTVFCNARLETPTEKRSFYDSFNRQIQLGQCTSLSDRHYFMIAIGNNYKALLRSPLTNRSSGIVEVINPRVRLTDTSQFISITTPIVNSSFTQYKNLFDSLIGQTMTVIGMTFTTCPDYIPFGPTLASYKVTGYQKNYNGRMLVEPVSKSLNGDQLMEYGKFVFKCPFTYIDPSPELDTPEFYRNYALNFAHNTANYFEYSNQFIYANKQNAFNLQGRFVNLIQGREPNRYQPSGWHWNGTPEGNANVLYSMDSISVIDPRFPDQPGSTTYTVVTHDVRQGYTAALVEQTFTRYFVPLDLSNAKKYVEDRTKAFMEPVVEKFQEKNIKLNCFYGNITTENPLCVAPWLRDQIFGTLPFTNDPVAWPGHSPNNDPAQLHQSINPWQATTSPSEPEPGFTAAYQIGSPWWYGNFVRGAGNIINPRNEIVKNWLRAHASGTEGQKNAVNTLFTYAYAQEVTAGNIEQYINRDFQFFITPRDSWLPPKNVYNGYTSFGRIGFNEQYFYGQIIIDKLGSMIYTPLYDVPAGNAGITGFSGFNFINYATFKADIQGRTIGNSGGFELSDSIPLGIQGTPDISGHEFGNVNAIQWYGTFPNTNNEWIMTGSYVYKLMEEQLKLYNYLKYPIPNNAIPKYKDPDTGITYDLYDNLAMKTFPFWVLVRAANYIRSLWRNNPNRKQAIWLCTTGEMQNRVRDSFYRQEYNIHGLLMTSDDVDNPYFAPFNETAGPDNSIINPLREVNKIIQNNKKRLIYTQDPYSFNYMSPTYLNMSLDGKTYSNILNIPPLTTSVEFGGENGTDQYPYLACRVTLPLPRYEYASIPGDGGGYLGNFVAGGGNFGMGTYDFGRTLSATETYPNFPPQLRVGVSFGDGSEAIYQPGLTRSAGFWIVGENNNKFRNMNFRLILGACGSTGACCSGTGGDCFGITSIDNCSQLNGFFLRGKTSCDACNIQGILPSFEIET